MKKLLLLFVVLLPLLASAHDFEVDGIYYNTTSSTTVEVTFKGNDYRDYNNEYSGSIVIPATVTNEGTQYSVTSIGKCAFEDCSSLISITIPDGVTSIGGDAFSYCYSLTAITIPDGVTSIGSGAFYFCKSLTAITIPEGVTNIKENTFRGCNNLTSVIIPESVTSIGEFACYYCPSLTAITIPKNVTSIGEFAFSACSSLTVITITEENTIYDSRGGCNAIIETASNTLIVGCSTTIIPEGVTNIGKDAFAYCSSLTNITIPEGVTSIGSNAFYKCDSLTDITIPKNVTSIGERAFSGCSNLTYIIIPESVTSIGNDVFNDCRSLTDITIPESITIIGSNAFYNCRSLTTITIPKSVTSIGSFAFYNCSSLTTITCEAETPPTMGWNGFNNVNKSIPVYVPAKSVEAYRSAEYWNEFTNIIGIKKAQCSTPTISYQDGRFSFTCDTEGAEVITHAAIEGEDTFSGLEFEFTPTLTFTAYATKENYENSDVATLTLCWIPCTEEHKSEETGILAIPSKPVLISTQGGTITLSGLAADTEVAAYDTAGTQLATTMTTTGTATLTTNLTTGDIAIVKIGDYSIKVVIR